MNIFSNTERINVYFDMLWQQNLKNDPCMKKVFSKQIN